MNEKDENPYASPSSDVVPDEPRTEVLASRWLRLFGAIIDGAIAWIVWFPLLFFTDYWARMQTGVMPLNDSVIFAVLGFIIFVVIHGYLLANRGQTVGKFLLGMRIVSYEDDRLLLLGKLLGLRYLPMNLITLIPFVGQFLGLVNALWIFTEEKRCIHDYLAGTKVVRLARS